MTFDVEHEPMPSLPEIREMVAQRFQSWSASEGEPLTLEADELDSICVALFHLAAPGPRGRLEYLTNLVHPVDWAEKDRWLDASAEIFRTERAAIWLHIQAWFDRFREGGWHVMQWDAYRDAVADLMIEALSDHDRQRVIACYGEG